MARRKLIDTAVNGYGPKYGKKVYFLVGNQYIRYDLTEDKVDQEPLPLISRYWNGWPKSFESGVDVAFRGVLEEARYGYFLKGDRYLRFDFITDRVDVDPAPVSERWPGMPAELSGGVDAVLPGAGTYAQYLYFFKGKRYGRFNHKTKSWDQPVGDIAQWWPGWPDWPSTFMDGVDAAFLGQGTKAYFFKGDRTLRYNFATNTVDRGEEPIATRWDGLMARVAPDEPWSRASRWFHATSTSLPREGNHVVAYPDGASTFADMVRVIRTARGPEHGIFIIGWYLDLDFPLIPGDLTTTLRALLLDAAMRGVRIRALLTRHPPNPITGKSASSFDNQPQVDFINMLPGSTGLAIHDAWALHLEPAGPLGLTLASFRQQLGLHHQKLLVVNGSEGLVGFCGGIDINRDRLPSPTGPGLHDVHCRITGPAAVDLAHLFRDRWNHHPDNAPYPPRQISQTFRALPTGRFFVQVACTYPDGSAHPGIRRRPASPWGGWVNEGYPFAPKGDTSARGLIHHAISQARRYIYIEDQFLVDQETSTALLARLPNIEALIILITHSDAIAGELLQPWRRRRDFLLPLLAAAPDKVVVRYGVTQYIHSKSFIFDDEFLITGSANCSRRGYTHDSEVVAGSYDGRLEQRSIAKELRMRLWARHLGVPIQQLVDWRAGFALWKSLPSGAQVAPYDPNAKNDPNPLPTPAPPGPSASVSEKAWYEIVRRISAKSGNVGVNQLWDLIIDPDGRAPRGP